MPAPMSTRSPCVLYEMLVGRAALHRLDRGGDRRQMVHGAGAERAGRAARGAGVGGPGDPARALARRRGPVRHDGRVRQGAAGGAIRIHTRADACRRHRRPPRQVVAACLRRQSRWGSSPSSRSDTSRRNTAAPASEGPKVLAVLPFENLGDSADAYFADGIANELRGKLSQLDGVEVIARGSSNQYRGTHEAAGGDRPGARRELPADRHGAVGQGVRAAPSRVRVTPELVEVAAGHAAAGPLAAAVRRGAHRRLRGAGRHRGQGGRRARRGAGRQRPPRARRPSRPRTSRPTTSS